MSDFLNLYRAPGESAGSGGGTTFLYRAHPSKPDDTLMATNYAYMLARIFLNEPMFADTSLKLRLENTLRSNLAYVHPGFPGAISG